MSIRNKLLMVVIPILVPPLIIGGVAAALSARSGISAIAQEFLQFKAEELQRYAREQWQVLLDNDLTQDESYVRIVRAAVESYARGMIRRETELILALDDTGEPAFSTVPVDLVETERDMLATLVEQRPTGWSSVRIGGHLRVAQAVPFEPLGWVMLVTERESVFFRVIRDINRQTGLIVAVSVLMAIVLLVVFTRTLLLPLSRMADSMHSIIGAHDLSSRVPILYRDEIGDLGHTFNVMTEELEQAYQQIKQHAFEAVVARRQEQKIRNIFQKYVPLDIVDQFVEHPESMLVGQTRPLAVLFSDIRSFTSIAERLPPEQIVESLNDYFSVMVDAIIERGGIVDKYIGDAVMAFFGAPIQRDSDAREAVISGLNMLDALQGFNRNQQTKGLPMFQIGIGINFGPVTIGNIGSEKKMDYTVVGDMVNLASRLEGLTKIYHVPLLVSESVYKLVHHEIPCRLVDRVTVKGKHKVTHLYEPALTLTEAGQRAWRLQDKGLEFYYQGNFNEAARHLLLARQSLPNDPVIKLFLVRCKHYIATPPGSDWNGVITLTEK